MSKLRKIDISDFLAAECHIDKNSDLVKLHYCNSAKIIDIPKCCGLGENLNLKGGRCTKQWALEKFKLPQHFTNSVISRFRYTSIWKMNKSRNLVSTNSSFELDWKTGELIYQNKRYPKVCNLF